MTKRLHFLALVASLLTLSGTAFAQFQTSDPISGLAYCHQPGMLPVPMGPTVGGIAQVLDPATGSPVAVEAGKFANLTGLQFTFDPSQVAEAPTDGPLPTTLAGTQLLVDNVPARLAYMRLNWLAMPFPSILGFQPVRTAGSAMARLQLLMTEPDGTACITPYSTEPAVAVATPSGRILIRRGNGYGTIHFTDMKNRGVQVSASVLVNGQAAAVIYADSSEISFRLPEDNRTFAGSRISISHPEHQFELTIPRLHAPSTTR